MASGMFFVRSCPTCGRKLEIRVELLGRDVECVHCSATFKATEDAASTNPADLRIEQAIARAQQYIESVSSCGGPLDSASAESL